MLKSGGEAVTDKEEAEKNFKELMDKAKEAFSGKKYTKFANRVRGLRHYHYIREATQYLWESEFEHCRYLLHKLADLMAVPYNDLLYLFEDELYEVCKKGKLGAKEDIIKNRKKKRAFAVAYWDKCME